VTSQWPSRMPLSSLASGSTRFFSASPCQVSAISAPAAWHALAMPQAIERLLATPRMTRACPASDLNFATCKFPIELDHLSGYTALPAGTAQIRHRSSLFASQPLIAE